MGWSRRAQLAAAVAAMLLAGCGTGPPGPPAQPAPTAKASVTRTGSAGPQATQPAPATSSPAVPLPVAPGAGALPQTRAFPSTHSAAFRNAMTDLWLAVTTGKPRLGLPAFFPVA